MDQSFLELISASLPRGVEFTLSSRKEILIPVNQLRSQISKNENNLLGKNASEKRIREFCLGRLVAKSALAKVFANSQGHEFEILRSNFRAPLWPDGSVGSISHCSNRAVAVAGRSDRYQGLGVDLITKNRIVNPKILVTLCSTSEQNELVKVWDGDLNLLRLIVFSAKESLYKLFSNLNVTQMEWVDFDLRLPRGEFDRSNFKFDVNFSSNVICKMNFLGITNRRIGGISINILVSDEFVLSFGQLSIGDFT